MSVGTASTVEQIVDCDEGQDDGTVGRNEGDCGCDQVDGVARFRDEMSISGLIAAVTESANVSFERGLRNGWAIGDAAGKMIDDGRRSGRAPLVGVVPVDGEQARAILRRLAGQGVEVADEGPETPLDRHRLLSWDAADAAMLSFVREHRELLIDPIGLAEPSERPDMLRRMAGDLLRELSDPLPGHSDGSFGGAIFEFGLAMIEWGDMVDEVLGATTAG